MSAIFGSRTKGLDFHSDPQQSMNIVVFYYLWPNYILVISNLSPT